MIRIINEIQDSIIYKKKSFCEPFLTKYNLINTLSKRENKHNKISKYFSDILAYSDQNTDEKELSKLLKLKISKIKRLNKILEKKKLIKEFI